MYFKKIIFEQAALDTDYGKNIYDSLINKGFHPEIVSRYTKNDIPGADAKERFKEGKRTLIIGVRNPSKFESCRPSANYQLPVLSGCPGLCEYCYIMTRSGKQSYVKLNANIVKIFTIIQKYIEESMPEITSFELSASSDPIPFEEPTKIVSTMIEHFAGLQYGRLRICTKFEPEPSILNANHNGHTDFRFSVNTPRVIDNFEHATPSLEKRIEAARKIIDSGYRTGIMIAPVFLDDGWRDDYKQLLIALEKALGSDIYSFEVVTHRFTAKARETIKNIFPDSQLDMDEEKRKFKMGQFGYGKYLYEKDKQNEAKEFFNEEITRRFPNAKLLYVV